MSRKHYREAAAIIATIIMPGERERIAKEFASMFKHDNAAFDFGRFYTACDVDVAS